MNESWQTPLNIPAALRVAAGEDRFGEHRGLGISAIAFKITPQDVDGLLIIENSFREKGGPARHLHYEQEEWFYAVEGEFIVEIGQERFRLNPGDSLLAPRQVPHAWASVGERGGRGQWIRHRWRIHLTEPNRLSQWMAEADLGDLQAYLLPVSFWAWNGSMAVVGRKEASGYPSGGALPKRITELGQLGQLTLDRFILENNPGGVDF